MITISRIKLENFMNISSLDLEFSNSSINVFHGDNGQGKSSVLEAISICFTERRRGDSFKDFVKHGTDTAIIELWATYGDEDIYFKTHLYNKKYGPPTKRKILYKEVEYNNSECSPLLNSFGLDYLQHILFSHQGESNITNLKPSERTKVLKRIFDFELKPQLDLLDSKTVQDQENLLVHQTQFDTLKSQVYELQELKPELDAIAIQRYELELEGIEREIKDIEHRYYQQEGLRTRHQELKMQESDLQRRVLQAKENESDLQRTLISLHGDIGEYETKLSALEDPEALKTLIQEKMDGIKAFEDLIVSNTTLIEEKETSLQSMQKTMLELSNHIEAHAKGVCPACGQTTKPESVPSMKEQHEELSTNYDSITNEKLKLSEAQSKAMRSRSIAENEIVRTEDKITQIYDNQAQYTSLLQRTQKSVTVTIDATEKARTTLTNLEAQLNEIQVEISTLTAQLGAGNFDTFDLKHRKAELDEILSDNKISKELNKNIKAQNEKTAKEEAEHQEKLEKLSHQINDISNQLTQYREAKRILSVELPNYIIVKACSKLEQHINSFIENVKPGMVVRLLQSRGGVEFYYSPNGEETDAENWMSTKMASGFERELLSMAWRVALAKAYNLSILMLDEIDSAASTRKSEKVFRELARAEGFDQLFIISHKPEIVDILDEESDRVQAWQVEAGVFTLQEY